MRVTLSDGTEFQSTGCADTLTPGGLATVPDSGHAGNLVAFCNAFAPPPMHPTGGPRPARPP